MTYNAEGKRTSLENLLDQNIREERSGFQGAVLATTHAYDSFGRLDMHLYSFLHNSLRQRLENGTGCHVTLYTAPVDMNGVMRDADEMDDEMHCPVIEWIVGLFY